MTGIRTKRLFIRECTKHDFKKLASFLQDEETMYAYEHGFTEQEVHELLAKQMDSYTQNRFGLWAVTHQKHDTVIGLCGVTLQRYNEKTVPELGYIFHKAYWHNGYAFESASACMNFAFSELNIPKLYAIIRDTNHASQKLAQRLGMEWIDTIIKQYWQMDMPHLVFAKNNRKKQSNPAS